jgi:hypothetical protein
MEIKKGNMNALDWGKTTEERNKNIEAYEMEKVMKTVFRYQFDGHEFDYEYLYSIREFRLFCICNEENLNKEYSDKYILTKDNIPFFQNESQVTIEALLIDELMTIDIKYDSIEFVDIALSIIDALSKKEPGL